MASLNKPSIDVFRDFPYFDKIYLYAHDMMVKHKQFDAAAALARTHNLDLQEKLEIDVPEGYFHVWLQQKLRENMMAVKDGRKKVVISHLTDFPFYDKIHRYIHDSMVKQNHIESAAEFARTYNVDPKEELEIDVPEGYYYQWSIRNISSHERSYLACADPMGSLRANLEAYRHNTKYMLQKLGSNDIPTSIQTVGPAYLNGDVAAEVEVDNKTEITDTFYVTKTRCLGINRSKITCCHASSCGEFLASAGHELMVIKFGIIPSVVSLMEVEHSDVITDVRFKPNSTQIATSSFDKTILFWDATKSRKSLFKLEGHGEKVMSLDFNEKDTDLLCSCDTSNEIRFWNLSGEIPQCVRTFQGGNMKVRFRPQSGNLLAAASGSTLNIIDVETCQILNKFEGHTEDIKSICWDESGNHIASVSISSARIWSLSSGECTDAWDLDGFSFESCIFNPRHPDVLFIASHEWLILWSPKRMNETGMIPAHPGIISSLAHAPKGEIVTGGHDQVLKLWNYRLQNSAS